MPKILAEVVHSCFTDKMFRKMSLEELRPATEAYLELSRISKMEVFTKTVNGFYPWTIFGKKLHRSCLLSSKYASLQR